MMKIFNNKLSNMKHEKKNERSVNVKINDENNRKPMKKIWRKVKWKWRKW